MNPAIQINGLVKSYGREDVLKGIDVAMPNGKTTLILGHNGCGKTTLMKCIVGLVKPTAGKIAFPELPAGVADVRETLGYLPQRNFFPDNITPEEIFELIEDLYDDTQLRHAELMDEFELQPFLTRRVKELSGGTLQKVSAVCALMTSPTILLLDEPTAGLDPGSRFKFKQMLASLKKNGVTILITSHIVREHEELCDYLVILSDGQIRYEGSPEELRAETQVDNLEHAVAAFLERSGS